MPATNPWRCAAPPARIVVAVLLIAALIGFTTPAHGQGFTVQGSLWVDANGNGQREAGEGTLPGTRVHLMYVGRDGVAYTNDDQQIDLGSASTGTATIAPGSFRFSLGGAGERYYVAILQVNKPRGYMPTLYRQGDAATDSDLLARTDLPAFVTDTFVIDYGARITGIDLGLIPVVYTQRVYVPLIRR